MSDHPQQARTRWHLGRALVGLVLIFVGLVYVGVYLGIFDWVVWANIWRLWPLLLVGIGLGLIVQNKFSVLGVIFVFLILVVFGFWMLWQQSTFHDAGNVSYRDVDEALIEGVERGSVSIDVSSGDIRLSGPADTEKFAYGRIETKGSEHAYDVFASDKTQTMQVSTAGVRHAFVAEDAFIELQLSQLLPYDISLDAGKADITLDFTSLTVMHLDISTGASTISIAFSDRAEQTDVAIDAGASTIALSAPDDVAVKIYSDSGIATTNFEGLEKQDENTYASDGYETAEKTLSVAISSGVSTISFSRP